MIYKKKYVDVSVIHIVGFRKKYLRIMSTNIDRLTKRRMRPEIVAQIELNFFMIP